MFIIGKIVGSLLMPPGILVFLVAVSVFLGLLRRRRAAIAASALALVLGWSLSIDPIAFAIVRPLETAYPPLGAVSLDATAIVVLGGGYVEDSPEYGNRTILSPETLQRALYGAEIAKVSHLPIVWTSGNPQHPDSQESDAETTRRLWIELGVDPGRIRVESRSKDTSENARFTVPIVGSGPVILVTSAWHMPRAMLAFAHAGIRATAAPTAYHWRSRAFTFYDLLPSAEALRVSSEAIHEYVGLAWYSISGR